MKIAFDVMSGDLGSKEAILAACQMVKEFTDLKITLVGNEAEIKNHLQTIFESEVAKNLDIHHANDIVPMTAGPFEALRMPNSSMSQAVRLVKEQKVDGVISSGSTAAYLGVCHLLLGEISGIKRPAFMPIMPTLKGTKVLVLDIGANIENTSDELISFALMANIYSKAILKIAEPKVALLNIGLEANKGPKVTKETYAKLSELTLKDSGKLQQLNFCGNIEPREVLNGEVDIVVCDGYSGNVLLKSFEGITTLLFTLLKQAYKKNLWTKLLGLMSKPVFKTIKTTFDYKNTGGAQLIGINGICFKAHGSSDVQSYYSTLKLLRMAIEQDVTNKIKDEVKKIL